MHAAGLHGRGDHGPGQQVGIRRLAQPGDDRRATTGRDFFGQRAAREAAQCFELGLRNRSAGHAALELAVGEPEQHAVAAEVRGAGIERRLEPVGTGAAAGMTRGGEQPAQLRGLFGGLQAGEALAPQLGGSGHFTREQQEDGAQRLRERGAVRVGRAARCGADEAEPGERWLAFLADRQQQAGRGVGAAGERERSGDVALAHEREHLLEACAQVERIGAVLAPPQAPVGPIEDDATGAREQRTHDLCVGGCVEGLRRQGIPSM